LSDREEEPELFAVCSSVDRLLRKGMANLRNDEGLEKRQLYRLNTKLLNTFRGVEMSQDPIKPLQNNKSISTYISCWQKLICYFWRVTRDNLLQVKDKQLFRPTERQKECLTEVCERVSAMAQAGRLEGKGEGIGREEVEKVIDRAVLNLSMSVIQHRLTERAFDSVMVSFAAMLAWDSTKQTWKGVNNYTSYLSQLIYDCQIIVLLYCLEITGGGE